MKQAVNSYVAVATLVVVAAIATLGILRAIDASIPLIIIGASVS